MDRGAAALEFDAARPRPTAPRCADGGSQWSAPMPNGWNTSASPGATPALALPSGACFRPHASSLLNSGWVERPDRLLLTHVAVPSSLGSALLLINTISVFRSKMTLGIMDQRPLQLINKNQPGRPGQLVLLRRYVVVVWRMRSFLIRHSCFLGSPNSGSSQA